MDLKKMTLAEKLFRYVSTRTAIFEEKAVYSDGSLNYREPHEPEVGQSVKVRLRTKKNNVDKVYVNYLGKKIEALLEESDELFDYYVGTIEGQTELTRYCFELHIGRLVVYYNKKGATREPDHYFDFKIVPGFKTPDWAKGAIMYQIFVDRFYNGDQRNDPVSGEYVYIGQPVSRVKDWSKSPAADGVREFYGGDLQGVYQKLSYLHELGIEVIYLNPIFVSPSNHKYDIQDYDYVDPHFGIVIEDDRKTLEEGENNRQARKYIARTTDKGNLEASNALLIMLIEKIHSLGMKVILDGVFNHCGSFNKWLDREELYRESGKYPDGAYVNQKSPYRHFFYFHNKEAWPNNPNYDGWWGHDTLPKLNYEGSAKLYRSILAVAAKWVSPPFKADGWRLDVAADLGYSKEFNHQFWRDFRQVVKKANPEALILAEHYGDASDWVQYGDQWDTVMNYDAFMEPVSWFFTGMEKHSDEYREDLLGNGEAFRGMMSYNMARLHHQSLEVAMNELSNHDHSRFLTRTNHQVGRLATAGAEAANQGLNYGVMKEAVVVQLTWPGAPTIYYGDEVGVCGWTDPDNRRTYPWGQEDEELLSVHKRLISLRKSLPVLRHGSLKIFEGAPHVLSFGRFDKQDKVVVVCNNHHQALEVRVPVWEIGFADGQKCQQIFQTTPENHTTHKEIYDVRGGEIILAMPPFSARVLKNAKHH